ncbi:MAG: flippase-like domain-containing protein [Proteobacteria bacterium]|nr:flippase-like domain-containing protein [Pseudomonadota bacterium]
MKHRWALLLKGAVSALLILYLARAVDLEAAFARLAALDPAVFALALGVLYVQAGVHALRWALVLRFVRAPVAFARVAWITLVGFFFSQALPATVGGDAVRAYYLHRAGHGVGASVKGVLAERVVHMVGSLLLVAAGQPWMVGLFGDSPVRWAMPAALAAMFAGVALVMRLDRLPVGLDRWRAVRWLGRLAADLRRMLLSAASGPLLVALSVAGHVLVVAALYLLARGLEIPVSFALCLVLAPPALLLATVPISIAGWGVREGALVTAFGLAGVAPESALVLSILFGLAAIGQGLPGAVLWLIGGAERPRVTGLPPD